MAAPNAPANSKPGPVNRGAGGRPPGMSERPPRERMILAAAKLMRRQGVNGTGVREIVEQSGAPWGSFRHYFPGGKDQLISEAILFTGDFAGRRIAKFLASAN